MRFLLDTHVLIWLAQGDARLGPLARRTIDDARSRDQLYVSAVTFWETAMLHSRSRIILPQAPDRWRHSVLTTGIEEFPLDGVAAVGSVEIAGFHADPADRFLVATALTRDATLLTADEKILAWSGPLIRQDARL
ncbi:type II toxin-antitoxin system VapC family toxin [Azospirillum sp. sgz301742]